MKLTENFSKSEFDSKDGTEMTGGVLINISTLADQLQVLRDFFNATITINSGYRSPAHNKKIGGVSNSKHTIGKAADIVVDGYTTDEVYDAIEFLIDHNQMLQGGLGLYDTFVHYDIRGVKARWNYKK